MVNFVRIFTLLVVLVNLNACYGLRAPSGESQSKEWTDPEVVNEDVLPRSKRKTPVVIYYANESQRDKPKEMGKMPNEMRLIEILMNPASM